LQVLEEPVVELVSQGRERRVGAFCSVGDRLAEMSFAARCSWTA
jgi:hypothetical protein